MIDTIQLKIATSDVKEINLNKIILKYQNIININKSKTLNSGITTLVLRDNNNKTTSLNDYNTCLNNIEKELGVKIILNRFDLATDLNESIKNNKELFFLFQTALNYTRTKSIKNIFSTTKDFSTVNYKIKDNSKWETTIYDHKDKPGRSGNTRIEQRFLNIRRSLNNINTIKKKIVEYNKELDSLTSHFTKVEDIIVDNLYNHWVEEKTKYHNINSFIDFHDIEGRICTRDILDKLLKKMEYNGQTESFIKNFRRRGKNRLNFVSKNTFKQLIQKIKSENKKTLS